MNTNIQLYRNFITYDLNKFIDLRGKIVDHEGNPLLANVTIEGTSTGVMADLDGKYFLPNVPENAIIDFSFQGIIHKVPALEVKDVVRINTSNVLDQVIVTAQKTNKNYLPIGLGIAFLIGVLVLSSNKKPIKASI